MSKQHARPMSRERNEYQYGFAQSSPAGNLQFRDDVVRDVGSVIVRAGGNMILPVADLGNGPMAASVWRIGDTGLAFSGEGGILDERRGPVNADAVARGAVEGSGKPFQPAGIDKRLIQSGRGRE